MCETDCPKYEGCDAQLCPLAANLDNCVWYGDEPICSLRRFASLPWVKTQKKIRKLGIDPDDGCFTKPMLEAITQVRKGVTGADPDAQGSVERWLKARVAKGPRIPALLENRVESRVPVGVTVST